VEESALVKDLFRRNISGRGSITQNEVMSVVNAHLTAPKVLSRFTANQIVAKVRYEKQKKK